MASSAVLSALNQLQHDTTDPAAHSQAYADLLSQISSSLNIPAAVPNLTSFIQSILIENNLGIVTARPLLNAAIDTLKWLPASEFRITAGTSALASLESRVVSFEEQDTALRYIVADAHEEEENWLASARILQAIQVESSQRKMDDKTRLAIWLRICRLYLEEDDTVTAESYLKRAKNVIHILYSSSDPDDAQTKLKFDLSQARIFDAQCRFLDASSAYYTVSMHTSIDEDERLKTLSMALTCAVLAPAGPSRSRILAKLYKDDRSAHVSQFGMLEKIFLDRVLEKDEVEAFAAGLQPHQLARTADGRTVLAKAVIEHNLLSASRVYANIGFDGLAALLDLDRDGAEAYASAMLQQGRLRGSIDQIDGVISFDANAASNDGTEPKLIDVGTVGFRDWDAKVQGVAEEVERVASMLQARHPNFSDVNMVH